MKIENLWVLASMLVFLVCGCADSRAKRPPLLSEAMRVELERVVAAAIANPLDFGPSKVFGDSVYRGRGAGTIQAAYQELLYHEDPDVRKHAATYITNAASLFALMYDPEPQVRAKALSCIVNRRKVRSAYVWNGAIDLGLKDESADVRKHATGAALRLVDMSTMTRAIPLLAKANDEQFAQGIERLKLVTGRHAFVNKTPTRDELTKNWELWFEANRTALAAVDHARFTYATDRLCGILTASHPVASPDSDVTLRLAIHNFGDAPGKLRAGLEIRFTSTGYSPNAHYVSSSKVITLVKEEVIPPYGERVFLVKGSSLKTEVRQGKHRVLTDLEGQHQIAAGWSHPADAKLRMYRERSALRFHPPVNTIRLDVRRRGADMMKPIPVSVGFWPRPISDIAAYFSAGMTKSVVDVSLTKAGRPSTVKPTKEGLVVTYPAWGNCYWRARYIRSEKGVLVLTGPPRYHMGRPGPKPQNASVAEWYRAGSGIVCTLAPTSPTFPAGSPATLDITWRNVSKVPRTILAPVNLYGQHTLMGFTICSEKDEWTEFLQNPYAMVSVLSTQNWRKRDADEWVGHTHSWLLEDGKSFSFLNAKAKLTFLQLPVGKFNPAVPHVRRIILAPGETHKLRTTLGGPTADHMTGHETKRDIWRIALRHGITRALPGKLDVAPLNREPYLQSNTITVEFVRK